MCHHHLVRIRGNVFPIEFHTTIGTAVCHTGGGAGQVQLTVIIHHSLLLGECSAQVFHIHRAEVLIMAIVVISGIVCACSAPERLFVELNLIHPDTTEDGGSELAVAQRQGILLPLVGDVVGCCRQCVPKGMFCLRAEIHVGTDGILSCSRLLLCHGRHSKDKRDKSAKQCSGGLNHTFTLIIIFVSFSFHIVSG